MGTNSHQPCERVAVDDWRADVGYSLTFEREALGIASDRLNRVEKPAIPSCPSLWLTAVAKLIGAAVPVVFVHVEADGFAPIGMDPGRRADV
jgi:hypothetical protein